MCGADRLTYLQQEFQIEVPGFRGGHLTHRKNLVWLFCRWFFSGLLSIGTWNVFGFSNGKI